MAFTARAETVSSAASLTTPFSFTINKATGVVDGDIMFMFLTIYVATPATVDSVPAGWQVVATNATSNTRWYLYYKVASGEGASYTWSLTKSCRYYALNAAYTAGDWSVSSMADITAISNTLYGTAGAPVRAASMSVSAVNSPLLYFASVYSTASKTFTKPILPTTGWVEDADIGGTTPDLWVTNGSMIWAGSGATGTMDVTCSATITTEKHAFAISLKPPLTTKMQINIGDTWKVVAGVQINIGDVWKNVVSIKQNIGDTWKAVFGGETFVADYYVATDGNDANAGTLAAPFKTWQKGFATVGAGQTLAIRGGTYTDMLGLYGSNQYGVRISARDGTAGNPIKVQAYPGETPILDCSSFSALTGIRYGILLTNCDYWNIKGLTVKNVIEYATNKLLYTGTGWEINDGTNITLDQCVVTTSMNGFTVSGTVTNLRYQNCDAHHNYDYYDAGGLANGFGGNMAATSTIVFDGCRSWSNSDDGWDCYAGHGYITFNNCWAWRNGYDVPTVGNGDGFKLGPPVPNVDESGVQRTVTNCLSWDNYLMGFDESMDVTSSMDMALYNNVAYRNNRDFGFRFSAAAGTGVTTLRNNIAYLNGTNYQGRARNVTDHNTWDAGAPVVSAADFVSLDSTGADGARGANGELPVLNFLKLATGSDMINAGVNVGIAYLGAAPDLGAYEKE